MQSVDMFKNVFMHIIVMSYGEELIRFPSIGFFESLKEAKKERHCAYCKKLLKDNPWWDIFSFRPFVEIGKDSKTGEWIYVCEPCTSTFVKDFSKQLTKIGNEFKAKEKKKVKKNGRKAKRQRLAIDSA